MDNLLGLRRKVALFAQDYKNGRISWQVFINEFSWLTTDDEFIDELIDLIEHEPKRGGFLGVSDKEWLRYEERIQQLILELLT